MERAVAEEQERNRQESWAVRQIDQQPIQTWLQFQQQLLYNAEKEANSIQRSNGAQGNC